MGTVKFILINIIAKVLTGNPYKDIESLDWYGKTLFYTFFDIKGCQLGRSKRIQLDKGQSIPAALADAICDPNTIKIAWDACKNRIYASRLLGYPPHQCIDCISWIDLQVLARLHGWTTDSVTKIAHFFKINHKIKTDKDRFKIYLQLFKILTADGCINLRQLAGYTITQVLNDKGIYINQNCLSAGLRIIKLYEESIVNFKTFYYYNGDKKDIKNDFMEYYNLQSLEDIYSLLVQCSDLSDFERGLINILQFSNSSTIFAFKKIKSVLCSDGYLRGTATYFYNEITGIFGGINILNKEERVSLCNSEILLEGLGHIDFVDIFQSEYIINILKTLIPLLFVNKDSIIIDLSRIIEYVIARLTGTEWRLEAYQKDNLDVVLKIKWKSVSLKSSAIVKMDEKLSMGEYGVSLEKDQINEWKSINRDVICSQGQLLYIAYKAFTDKNAYKFQEIIFQGCDDSLIIQLPSKRIIRIPLIMDHNRLKLTNTEKILTGASILRIICESIQRDVLTHMLHSLTLQKYKILYYTNNRICIDNVKPLPESISSLHFVKILFF